jgi:transcriptional regulator with XRE-family HTH domain
MTPTRRDNVFQLTLGSRIAEARHRRKMTQAQLAEAVGIDARSMQRIEAGRTAPSLERLRAIAEVVGVSPGKLMDASARMASRARDQPTTEEVTLRRVWEQVPEDLRPAALRILQVLAAEGRSRS